MSDQGDDDFIINFTGMPNAFRTELEALLPQDEAELMQGQGFTGQDVLSVIGSMGGKAVDALAAFLTTKKQTEAARRIEIETEGGHVKLEGFGGEDVAEMKDALLELIEATRDK